METKQHSHLFPSGIIPREWNGPVWRRGFRAAICRGRGAGCWAVPEHRGNETEVMLPPSSDGLAPTPWHRQPYSLLPYPGQWIVSLPPGSSPPGLLHNSVARGHENMACRCCPPLDCHAEAPSHQSISTHQCRDAIGNDSSLGIHPGHCRTTPAPRS